MSRLERIRKIRQREQIIQTTVSSLLIISVFLVISSLAIEAMGKTAEFNAQIYTNHN